MTFRADAIVPTLEPPCLYCCQRCETVPGGAETFGPRSRICTACGRSYILAGEFDDAVPRAS